jgi:hypothetical protein
MTHRDAVLLLHVAAPDGSLQGLHKVLLQLHSSFGDISMMMMMIYFLLIVLFIINIWNKL